MKVCKKCGAKFSSWAQVEGKLRNVGSRKYCLVCSPWGSRNTRNLSGEPDGRSHRTLFLRTCHICKRDFSDTGKRTQCNSCSVIIKRLRNKMLAISYLGGKCQKCGFMGDPSNMTFHHRDANEKEFSLSSEFNRMSWERLRVELDKCDLLCVGCHNTLHSRYDDPYIMGIVMADEDYWSKYPWFNMDVFDYLKKDVPPTPNLVAAPDFQNGTPSKN